MNVKFLNNLLKKISSIFSSLRTNGEDTPNSNSPEPLNENSAPIGAQPAQNSSAFMQTKKYDYSKFAVCIDNGHGEETPGKRSPYASDKKNTPALYLREYQFAREVASRLKAELEAVGVTVFLCTPETRDIALSTRARRANDFQSANPQLHCVFVSIHANASGSDNKWHQASGWECWTTEGKNNSDELAACLYDAADQVFPPLNMKVRRHGTTRLTWNAEKNFTVIYRANMPAVLTENFFQDNVSDCTFLLSETGIQSIVNVHVQGLISFAKEKGYITEKS
jgi:N-acetylmuramoyl-L-alanine amidase